MARGRSRPRSGALLERAGELKEIDGALRDATARVGRVLFVEGPPGIGKTELLDEARRRAQRRGMITLTARGSELEGHYPYGVTRQLFEPILRGRRRPRAMSCCQARRNWPAPWWPASRSTRPAQMTIRSSRAFTASTG